MIRHSTRQSIPPNLLGIDGLDYIWTDATVRDERAHSRESIETMLEAGDQKRTVCYIRLHRQCDKHDERRVSPQKIRNL